MSMRRSVGGRGSTRACLRERWWRHKASGARRRRRCAAIRCRDDGGDKAKDPNWKAPKTAWGHPNLEGVWTSDDMRSVQMSRAPQYGTRELLTPDEFARRASGDEGSRDRAVNQETILRNEFGVRTFGYTSFVVDPPNGQMPAMTAAGRARAANRDAGTFGPGPFNEFEDFTLYDRCITRGIVGFDPARAVRQRRADSSDSERSGPEL